jgi:hypothetical protein
VRHPAAAADTMSCRSSHHQQCIRHDSVVLM